jgi:hypothetical protein
MCHTAKLFKELLICRFQLLFYFITTCVFVLPDHLDQKFYSVFEKCALTGSWYLHCVYSPVTWSIYYANAFDNFKGTTQFITG